MHYQADQEVPLSALQDTVVEQTPTCSMQMKGTQGWRGAVAN